MTARFAGVVPACGASVRMGTDKALLDLDGASFLERVHTALTEGGCDPVLLVVSPERAPVLDEAKRLSASVLENPDPGEGPITSLRLALSHLAPDVSGVIWLPLDFPLVVGAHVTRLLAAADTSEAPIVLYEHRGKRGHPVFFRRSLFPELADPDLEGGARTVVHRHLDEAVVLEIDDSAVVTDVDTPSIYDEVSRGLDATRP